MSIVTYEGIVEGGQVHLKTNIHLPDNTRVYVVVPDVQVETNARVVTPRLAHSTQAENFKTEIVEASLDDPV